ncbi:MAG: 4Fe-4S dicluster domain-containing protein [Nitrospiraceae bacterium]|nr:4Fe-4S dicluster domain-containing protein [Nitrospiraceae bacterium]
MSDFYIYQDQKRCIGCRACEVHCKTENDVPAGPRLSMIVPVGPKVIDNVPRMHFVFMPCFHCEKPWCLSACPTGAVQKREKDGIVFIDQSLCVGCKSCITACPWGVPQWNKETHRAFKCDYCRHRVDEGLKPACVTGCVTGALKWVSPEESTKIRRERSARETFLTGKPF